MSKGYRVIPNADLRTLNTFGVAATAEKLVEVDDLDALEQVLAEHETDDLLLLGAGSNVVLVAPPARVIRLLDARIEAADGPEDTVDVRCAAGMNWHAFVMHTLEQGWFGLENLALIPGTVGASPVQNIGAYGVEVMDRITRVDAWDRRTCMPVSFLHDACNFSYRDSRFKHELDRYFITHVHFRLTRTPHLMLDYAGIHEELAREGITAPTPVDVARAVMRQRTHKLPDPAEIGNAGSFFKNPIVSDAVVADLTARIPTLPTHRSGVPGTRKLSAAWLIEQAGMKGYRQGDAGVSERHALVLVNHGQATGTDLLRVARDVAEAVADRFDVHLQPEPRFVGAEWQSA